MLDKKVEMSANKNDVDTYSEVRPKINSRKPPLMPLGKISILPLGVVDERNHDSTFIIHEQHAEYDNFDKNSYFASSFDDHDKLYDMDSGKDKMASSLGGWY